MHTEYLQSLRYKLQKRVRRVKATGYQTYIFALRQLWKFLDQEPLFSALQEELTLRSPNADSVSASIIKDGFMGADQKRLLSGPLSNEVEWAAVCMGVLRRFAEFNDPTKIERYVHPTSSTAYDDYFALFSDFYLIPFYEYLDERLDDPQFVLARLIRFRHLCEWFWRDDLLKRLAGQSRRAEKRVTERLYEFLYTEGLDIHIEPSSVSGEADMVSSQTGSDRLVAESKIFDPSATKSYLLQGFRQIYQYTLDYNSAFGYLVIFNTSDKQLRFAVSGSANPLPRVVLNHKTIFFVTIDLFQHDTTASRRPQADFLEITEDEILGFVKTMAKGEAGSAIQPT